MGLVAVAVCFLNPLSTYAISEAELFFYGQNNILMFNPDSCSSASLGAFNGNSTSGLTDVQASFVDTYHDIAATLSVEYGIPWETVVAQGILESASGSSTFAVERNNFFGIGAFDSDPDRAFSYDSIEEGWRGYYENIKKTSTYRNHGVFSGKNITDPYAYAQAIKDAGYATDENYVVKLSPLIAAIEERSSENGWQSSAELAVAYPEMLTNAAANAEGANISSSTSSAIICSSYLGSGELVAGGMTLQEAKEFMEPYRSIWPRNYHEPGGEILETWKINDTGCTSDLENCVAFVQYFICEYADICMGLPDGRNVVDKLLSSGHGFIDGGTTPKAYAIFSTNGPAPGSSSGNHTGVVLGIDLERNKIIIGEAGCSASFDFTNAREYDLSRFTDGVHHYAYTDGLIGF